MKYKDIEPYRARKLIIKKMEEYSDFQSSKGEAKMFSEGLRDIVIATADYSRLKSEVV